MERREHQPPTLPKNGRIGHPQQPNQSLGVDVLEWYHPNCVRSSTEKTRKGLPERSGGGYFRAGERALASERHAYQRGDVGEHYWGGMFPCEFTGGCPDGK